MESSPPGVPCRCPLVLWVILGLLGLLTACSTDPEAFVPGGPLVAVGMGGQGGVPLPSGANPFLPRTLPLPYVVAGAGGSTGTFALVNEGDLEAAGPDGGDLVWTLDGDPSLSILEAPARVGPGQSGSLVLQFAGANEETIAHATLSVQVGADTLTAAVFAVAGAPGLEAGAWEDVYLPGGHPCGQGLTIGLPTAPFPHSSAGFTDDTVRIFVPDGHRDAGVEDVVVHFHGHSTTVAETLAAHLYEQHVCASGVNAILVVPQGPVETSSGNFGKLMDPGGLAALVQQVLVVLYREQMVVSPILDQLVLTAHSGGYAAVAANLDGATNPLPVSQIHLYDAVYGYVSTFAAFADGGGVLRSNYTPGGGTGDENLSLVATLEQYGHAVEESVSQWALRDAPILIYAANTTHSGATRIDGAYGEALRFGLFHHARGPRVELRSAEVHGGTATISWFSPYDDDLLRFAVQTSIDGSTWTTAVEVGPTETSATFPLAGAARVRVLPLVAWLPVGQTLGSDIYAVGQDPSVLVVDGFDRVIDGSYGGRTHDFAAMVGEAAERSVASVSNEALVEGGATLQPYDAVIWLVGDESTADHSLSTTEQTLLENYVAGGGRVLVSGSELAYEHSGAAFLGDLFGAYYYADDSDSYSVAGVGPLAGIGSFSYGGPGAPYEEDYPDALGASGGTTVLEYANGWGAAVGIGSQGALVGFPLELIDDPNDRAAAVAALLGFVDP